MKNLVDSCGWIEYFQDGPNAGHFAKPLEDRKNLIVPSICILEVFKFILKNSDVNTAHQAVAAMLRCDVIELDASLALNAAKLGADMGLPLADSVILATALAANATLWTEDIHFKGIPGVNYVEKKYK
jgi:toxin FitB